MAPSVKDEEIKIIRNLWYSPVCDEFDGRYAKVHVPFGPLRYGRLTDRCRKLKLPLDRVSNMTLEEDWYIDIIPKHELLIDLIKGDVKKIELDD